MIKKTKILSIGYLPKDKGGKQLTGLATGIFNLENSMNFLDDFSVELLASDWNKREARIGNTMVYGWRAIEIIKYGILNPILGATLFVETLKLFRFRRIISLKRNFIKLLWVHKWLSVLKPDIVHVHGVHGALLSSCIDKSKHHVVLRIHGIIGSSLETPNFSEYSILENYVASMQFSAVTFVSSDVCREWLRLYGKFECFSTVILNGYSPDIFKVRKLTKKYDLVTVSGISRRKGQFKVLKALKALKSEGIFLSYLIVGGHTDIELLEAMKNYVYDEKLNVTFVDYVSQDKVPEYMSQAKYFILPSESEGFGQVYIESVACGIPVILPKNLPLSNEPNVLNADNSIMLQEASVESIYITLLTLSKWNRNYDEKKVADSLSHLHWSSIVKSYSQLYSTLDFE